MMGKLAWTKAGKDWLGIYGKFRALVRPPSGPLGFSHWSVTAGDKQGGSGGTGSIQASKKAAEIEVARFAEWLRTQSSELTKGAWKAPLPAGVEDTPRIRQRMQDALISASAVAAGDGK